MFIKIKKDYLQISDKQILEKDSHDLLVEKSVIEAQKDIFVIEKKMLELLVSIKETAIKIDENKDELANSRGKSRTEVKLSFLLNWRSLITYLITDQRNHD